jgi:hypothetical protein
MKKIALVAMAIILAALLAGCAKGDKTPPVISEISSSDITQTSAVITWTTDEPATSQVEYGLTASYGATTPLDSTLVTSHSVSMSGLAAGTTYHYRVKSEDASDNEALSEDNAFTTPIFADENLEATIRGAINKPSGVIQPSDLEGLHYLNASGRNITDITGLEHCANLAGLDLGDNQIVDITPLGNLTSLGYLFINNNQISDIRPLADLASLTYLMLQSNQISDIGPLADLTSLTNLILSDNQISDIGSLANLTSLTNLWLNNNQISDITPLMDNEGLGEGDTVDLRGNPLSTHSICTLIPELEARGVEVQYDEPLACIAYIYMSDTEGASSYQLFLEDNDYCVTLISMDNVATTDFSVYDLIVVGADTYTLQYDWGDADSVNAIDSSGKSIIGLGTGGACLFGELGLSISYGNAWNLTESSIYVVDPTHDIFTTPYFISVPEDRIIQLYEGGVYCHSLYEPYLSSEVVLLGREPDDMSHYPLAQEGQYILWGFTASPESMTQIGKDLFLNVVAFMLGAS